MTTVIYIDISDFVRTRSHTGIQRVVIEYLLRAHSSAPHIDYRVVFFNPSHNKFNRISVEELKAFLHNPKTYTFRNVTIVDVDALPKGTLTIFFDIDSIWNSLVQRPVLYPKIKEQNIYIFNFIYDLIPCIKPNFAHENTVRKYLLFLSAVYAYSDLVFFDSRSAEKDFYQIKKEIQVDRYISTRVVPLGSDYSTSPETTSSRKIKRILQEKYILFVGTIEPRKKQDLALDSFETLNQRYPEMHLVFVGKKGWNVEQTTQRIANHPLRDSRFIWLDSIDDYQLSQLYKNAFLVMYLSEYEGYGLPIAESLSYGNITLSSLNSSLYEVGEDSVDYIAKGSVNEITELVSLYCENSELYRLKKSNILKNFQPPKWDTFFTAIDSVMKKFTYCLTEKQSRQSAKKLQAVFISIDCNKLVETIKAIDKYMPFVSEYIIITQPELVGVFKKSILTSKPVTIIDENSILREHRHTFSTRDHQSKNWLLRISLLNLDILHNEFLMLDDDNRPILPLTMEYYITTTGEYNAYYYNDLIRWNNNETDYDKGQHSTKHVLSKCGYELLSYSSHMPQVINKKIFKEAVEKFHEIGFHRPLDEWSIYFNYAVSNYPYLFSKKTAQTMNWPAIPVNWSTPYTPKNYIFENFYDHIYRTGLFSGEDNLSVEKKTLLKKEELKPFELTTQFNQKLETLGSHMNMVHGVLAFSDDNIKMYLFSIPYVLAAAKDSWLTLELQYKLVLKNLIPHKINLYYFINDIEGYKTKIIFDTSSQEYTEGRVDFKISAKNLPRGKYNIFFDIEVDGRKLYQENSPYMSKLFIFDNLDDFGNIFSISAA